MSKREVRCERMFPDELEQVFEECPLAYFPYGLCEPHGPHCALGLDGLKAHAVACSAAREGGGIVAPSDYRHIHKIRGCGWLLCLENRPSLLAGTLLRRRLKSKSFRIGFYEFFPDALRAHPCRPRCRGGWGLFQAASPCTAAEAAGGERQFGRGHARHRPLPSRPAAQNAAKSLCPRQ